MRGRPAERNRTDLERQAAIRREKEELAKKYSLDKVTEQYIERLYLVKMYESEACIKRDPKNVTATLKKLKTKKAKYDALKTNITIRVKGFGWKWAHTPWSKGKKNLTIKELGQKLRTIIIKENKLDIPMLPDMNASKRCVSGILGTPTSDIMSLDAKYMDNKEELKEKAVIILRERESS